MAYPQCHSATGTGWTTSPRPTKQPLLRGDGEKLMAVTAMTRAASSFMRVMPRSSSAFRRTCSGWPHNCHRHRGGDERRSSTALRELGGRRFSTCSRPMCAASTSTAGQSVRQCRNEVNHRSGSTIVERSSAGSTRPCSFLSLASHSFLFADFFSSPISSS